MVNSADNPDWNSLSRAHASQKWRKQSASMGRDMTRAIVEAAHVSPGMNILDVACGSGEPAISLATLLEGNGDVMGVDISPEPLKIAEERAAQRGLHNVKFQSADAHNLPFPDNRFDRVTSRLGIMFFADLPRALGEIRRVLRPGGRATLLVWGPMEQPYFQTTLGTLLPLLPGASIPDSGRKMFAFGRPGVLDQLLRDAGFVKIKENFLTVPWTWPGPPEEVWQYFQEVTVPFAALLQAIPDHRREQIDAEILRAIAGHYDGKEIKFTATVNITSACK